MIVDDHPAVREALAIRIARERDMTVCAEAGDLAEAIELVTTSDPDVAVIDVALKSGSGIDLIKRLRERDAKLQMIVWSMYGEDLYARRALKAGARGYITKEQATSEIIDAVRHVLQGKVYLSPAMTEKLLQQHVGSSGKASTRAAVESLSDRELDVFRLIGDGVKTAEIASQLHLSVKTVETYRDRIRAKLNLNDGAELIRAAVMWMLENG
jgi:DNA-binding NarL/FixJ family response regulator